MDTCGHHIGGLVAFHYICALRSLCVIYDLCGVATQNVTVTNTGTSGGVQLLMSTPSNPSFITAPYV